VDETVPQWYCLALMIKITRQTDYGILILGFLAHRPEAVHTARDVSAAVRLPLPMVSKILKILARERIVASHRGVKGGYSLARPAQRISVASVLRALEGPVGMTECSTLPGSCDQEPVCPVRVNWQRISHAVLDALEKIPLSEMVAAPPPSLLSVTPILPLERRTVP